MTASIKRASKPVGDLALVPTIDVFADDRPRGTVIGTCTADGVRRQGCDAERQIAIDTGALRFQPLVRPGWGRQGIAYGPFQRASGLVLAVSITNGHNTSQSSSIPESFPKRIGRWLLGPGIDPWPLRLLAWARGPRKKATLRRFHWWLRSARPFHRLPDLNENLAVGWFTSPAPRDPVTDGCGFVMHAAEGENGELWVRTGDRCLPVTRRLQNLQIHYVIALRQRGAIYYAAAMPDAHGLAPFPMMRPIAVDPFNDDKMLYAGIHQCALGQIGFRVDTRVHRVHIERMPEFASALATAHAGDSLTGAGPLMAAERGGTWRFLTGNAARGSQGAACVGERDAIAVLDPGAPSGLVHALIALDADAGAAGLVWQARDERNHWLLKASNEGCELVRLVEGEERRVASDRRHRLRQGRSHSVQVLNFDGQLGCYFDGARLFDDWFDSAPTQGAAGVGIWLGAEGRARMHGFEAQPSQVPSPPGLRFEAAWARRGKTVELADNFQRHPGADLAGSRVEVGEARWSRTLGRGSIIRDSGGARVSATVAQPNPGRTFYTLPWHRPDFADLEVTITPPGTQRGEHQSCRCGLVFWQDNDNYLSFTAYLDDAYRGASLALFTKRHGFEELYDAIWTMVWDKITWGKAFRLRITCDGQHFLVLIDDEPVLQRSLTDLYPADPALRITRVGLAVNWEWGNDTGSRFQSFSARC